jgi:hypothetical protein
MSDPKAAAAFAKNVAALVIGGELSPDAGDRFAAQLEGDGHAELAHAIRQTGVAKRRLLLLERGFSAVGAR